MSPHWPTFLALVLCLGPVVPAQNTRNGVLPRPSIWAEPGPVIPWGQPVTIVCESPAGFDTFRLEKEESRSYEDVSNSQNRTLARFPIPAASEDTAGLYHCLYHKGVKWSEHSEPLQLEVTGDLQMEEDDSDSPGDSPGLLTEHVYILTGVSVTLFLCVIVLLALIFLYCRHRKMHNLTAVHRLPEKDREMHPPTPTAGGPPDVTYAQLDQWVLTQRTAQAVSPQAVEPTAEFSTYAALARR